MTYEELYEHVSTRFDGVFEEFEALGVCEMDKSFLIALKRLKIKVHKFDKYLENALNPAKRKRLKQSLNDAADNIENELDDEENHVALENGESKTY